MATGRRFSLAPVLVGRQNREVPPSPSPGVVLLRLRLRRFLRSSGRAFTSDKVAAAHMVYFLISAALFLPLIGGMLYFMRDVTDSQFDDDAGLEPKARSLLGRLMDGPGALEGGSTLWQEREPGEKLVEAGIRHDEERRRLSHEKLANLQRGGLETDDDTPFVDYPELKEALGLTKFHDFHLRLTPTGHERTVDPYGAKPLGATQVAYFGNLSDPASFEGNFSEFTDDAQDEVEALDALGLDYKTGEEGFTTTPYYPAECPGGATTQQGTVIGNSDKEITARGLLGTCSGEEKSYAQWFLSDYFWDEDGDYRFDALVFGEGVDLQFWMDAAVASDNTDEYIFLDFVEDGGTIIFTDATHPGSEIVSECTEDHCLLKKEGSFSGLETPDETNQMLYAPNRVRDDLPLRDVPWRVCDMDGLGGVDEMKGFIPVIMNETSPDPDDPHCSLVHFGATASDRYGADGGTVILANWDLADVDQEDTSRIFSNMLSYGILRTAYLDYGPQLPEDRTVRVVARTSVLELPTGEFVEVRAQIYLWNS